MASRHCVSATLAAIIVTGCPSAPQPATERQLGESPRIASTRTDSVEPAPRSQRSPQGSIASQTSDAGVSRTPPPWPPRPVEIDSKWCKAPMYALDERTCYALPEQPTAELMVYFHGLVPPSLESPQKDNLFEVVARASARAGVAVLLPLGLPELAPEKKFAGWYGWPTRPETYAEHAPSLITRVTAAKALLEAHVGRGFERLYLAGSSSGAYFVTGLALRGDLEADGYGAFSGGSPRLVVAKSEIPRKPFYVGYGSYDGARSSAVDLVAELERQGWPVSAAEHRTGHGAREVYLDEAFAVWQANRE